MSGYVGCVDEMPYKFAAMKEKEAGIKQFAQAWEI